MVALEIFRRQGATIEVRRVLALVELDVELQPAYAREVVLARIEEHAFEERSRRVERRRIARPQLAVDLDERLFRLWTESRFKVLVMMLPTSRDRGKKTSK